jgi:predicted DNA-binding ribbon-helix-helix protein
VVAENANMVVDELVQQLVATGRANGLNLALSLREFVCKEIASRWQDG